MAYNDFDVRMKTYEKAYRHYLIRSVPVILRIDGRSFHTFAKGFIRPFDDDILLKAMRETMKYLCENIPGCVLGYTQSDEITLVLVNKPESEPWFGYCQNKIESVAASMATMKFNKCFEQNLQIIYENRYHLLASDFAISKLYWGSHKEYDATKCAMPYDLLQIYELAIEKGAMFDCRAFNISKGEVVNNLIWRQQDASRNSVQQVAHTYFKHNELDNLSCDEIQEKLFQEKGINWSKYPARFKRGVCCVRKEVFISPEEIREHNPDYNEDGVYRNKWVLDTEIPIFTQDREYILKFLEE